MDVALSIVVPVYKVELYLKKCIDSILSQKLRDFEIILVDDGSPDNCGEICDNYAKLDDRIRVIHQENKGLTDACTVGINLAKGKYIGFVDSDDWIDNDMFANLYEKAIEYDCDIVCCDLTQEYGGFTVQEPISKLSGYFNREHIERVIFPVLVNDGSLSGKAIRNNRVTKIFKTELIRNNLKYYSRDLVYGEDYQLVFPCILDAQSIYIFNDFFPYHYRMNNQSLTRKYVRNLWKKYLKLNDHIEKISLDKNVYNFSSQIQKELLSYAIMSIDNEFQSKEMVSGGKIKELEIICNTEKLKRALRFLDYNKYSNRVKLLLWLAKYNQIKTIYLLKTFKVMLRKQ